MVPDRSVNPLVWFGAVVLAGYKLGSLTGRPADPGTYEPTFLGRVVRAIAKDIAIAAITTVAAQLIEPLRNQTAEETDALHPPKGPQSMRNGKYGRQRPQA